MSKVNVSKLNTLTGHNDCVYTLEKSQFDNKFFSGAGDGMVVCWDFNDPENGKLLAKLPNSVYGLHYSESLNILAVGHNYDGIHLIDWEKGEEVGSLNMTKASIFDIQSYQGHFLVGDSSGLLTVVEANTLQITAKVQVSSQSIRTIALNEEQGEVALGTSDNHIYILDLEDLKVKHKISAHDNSVFTLKYSPDKQLLLSAGRDAHLKIWDVNAGYMKFEDIVAHMYAINNIELSPDGKHFVTCSMDKSIKVWSMENFKLLKVIDKARHAGHGTSVNKLLWSKHNNTLVSASDDRTISVWNLEFNN